MTPRKLLALVVALCVIAFGCLVFKALTGSGLLEGPFAFCMVGAPMLLGYGIGRWGIRR